jgi:hypothetical protein
MSSHFKWYPSSEEVVVPWNARYSFPSQANKAIKITPRIPPKSGQTFAPGQIMRLEFPAQGYVNPTNTTLEFDVALLGPVFTTVVEYSLRFQNNIQSLFNRVRLLYGATPLEDIINYNVIVRCLTEWTGTNQTYTMDQNSIANGIGGVMYGFDGNGNQGLMNVRQKYLQGLQAITPAAAANLTGGAGAGGVPNLQNTLAGVQPATNQDVTTRRYQISFALGLFTQDKLIPVKFMASQLAIEITLAQPAECMFFRIHTIGSVTQTVAPTFFVGNVNLIPEILEFDSSYDAMFLRGLREGGVPIKFSSWHTFLFSSASSSSFNLLIQERSRSVKSLFTVQRLANNNFALDNGATFFSTSGITAAGPPVQTGSLQSYQYRIGGRYFPASPVQTALTLGSTVNNSGCEAFLELQKALNYVGDQRLSVGINTVRWAVQPDLAATLPAFDYEAQVGALGNAFGVPITGITVTDINAFCGNFPSCAFAAAIDLETSNGMEISGLNAEEQSDIAFLAQYSSPQISGNFNTAASVEVYSYYDAMIVLRENNVLELIQ